jgi:uncharacterized HAD superfamily protein
MMAKKSVNKPKAVVLDYDDTIVGFLQGLCTIHNAIHGTNVSHRDVTSWNFDDLLIEDVNGNKVTGKQLRDTFKTYENNGLYVGLQPLQYAVPAVNDMIGRGYKIIIVTARPEEYRKDTELNAIWNGIKYDKLIFSNDKVKTLKSLRRKYNVVMFADDKYETIEDVANNCGWIKHVCLINGPHNRMIEIEDEERIVRVEDLNFCLRELELLS